MMTKKDFIGLADVIKHHNKIASEQASKFGLPPLESGFRDVHLHVLADFCAAQNPRFDRKRWLDYIAGHCGPNGGAR